VLPFQGTYRIAAIVAAVHVVGAALTAWYVSVAERTDGQAVMLWVYWMIIDLPVSFLSYELLNVQPVIVHLVIGSLWWFVLAVVLTRLIRSMRGIRTP
jgi:hypothetical protein